MDKVRWTVVTLLTRLEKEQSYSTASLQSELSKEQFSQKDKGLLTELFYGTIQRQLTLDYYLEPFLKKPDKLELWVKQLLRMSVYQLIYLDKIPDHAVIYEAVQIAKEKGHQGVAKMVNGILRNIQRQGVRDFSDIHSPLEKMSVETSMPLWLVELLVEQYGMDDTMQLCQSVLEVPHLSVRFQSELVSASQLIDDLRKEGVIARRSSVSDHSLVIESGDWLSSTAFQKGLMTVQDESSALVAQVAGLQPSDYVLDTCAAPGGKTTHIASYLEADKGGRVIALDLHKNKLRKIAENATRLHVADRIEMHALDARKVSEVFALESFDAVFVDAPCSGLGLMRRKPEIKYNKTREDLHHLARIQLEILEAASKMVKSGGKLIYSTCTINQEENDTVIRLFLKRHDEYRVVPLSGIGRRVGDAITILPQDYHSDGFYICRLEKEG